MFLLLGLFALPPVRSELTERTGKHFSRGMVAIVLIIGAIAGMLAIGLFYESEGTASNNNLSSPESKQTTTEVIRLGTEERISDTFEA